MLLNNIVERQNAQSIIRKLAAQGALYSAAKVAFSFQLALSVPVIILAALAAMAFDKEWFGLPKKDFSAYVGILGLCITLLEILLLAPLISHLRSKAAKIQQCVDSNVLDLPWSEIAYGKRPDQEDIEFWADRNKKLIDSHWYNNWYRPEVHELPPDVARLICQRANCWWDKELRRNFNSKLRIAGWFLFISLLLTALSYDLTLTAFFTLVIAPFLPFLTTAPKLVADNRDAVARMEVMQGVIDDIWAKALQPGYDIASLKTCAYEIQGGIYANRSQNPLVPDWLANRLRPRNETLQQRSTQEYVALFKAAHPYLYP